MGVAFDLFGIRMNHNSLMGERNRPYGSDAGKPRSERYASAIRRLNEAVEAGYYVETIAIEESLICDRMESLANELSDGKFSYKTIGCLTDFLLGKKQKDAISPEIAEALKQIKQWAEKRNNAVHELAKLTPDMTETFDDSYRKLEDVAKDGLSLFRKLDNLIQKQRRKRP